jgi:hypothetical protein
MSTPWKYTPSNGLNLEVLHAIPHDHEGDRIVHRDPWRFLFQTAVLRLAVELRAGVDVTPDAGAGDEVAPGWRRPPDLCSRARGQGCCRDRHCR